MEKIITMENLRRFAYVNNAICRQPIRGMVVHFTGLNNRDMHAQETDEGQFYAEQNILYVIPYNNPWAWMNRQAVGYTDEILDVLFAGYDLPAELPIVLSGMSMGGLGALVYAVYAKRTPVACVVNCPACDAVYHLNEREDVPRTMYSALYNAPGTLEDALKAISPIHLADRMPRISYHVFQCGDDKLVDRQHHGDPFVEKMRSLSQRITYDVVPGRGHCSLTLSMKQRYARYILEAIGSGSTMRA